MNGGYSDIIKGIELAYRVYDIGFTYDNRADVRYEIFRAEIEGLRDEVRSFERLLKQLNSVLSDASTRYNGRRFSNRAAVALDPLSYDFNTERCRIVGNFNATLEECQKILEEKQSLSRKKSNALVNGAWYFQTQPKVEELRKRIHFHTTKILLVIDRLSFKLLTDLDAKVDDLVALSEENLSVSKETLRLLHQLLRGHSIDHLVNGDDTSEVDVHFPTDRVARRFEQHMIRHELGKSASDIPLVEGFDTLLLHFDHIVTGADDTKESYLTLLKARWLLPILKSSRQFSTARPGFYYKRAINQIEQAICLHVQEANLVSYDEDSLMALPDSSFAIWPQDQESTSTEQDPMVARATEEEVVRLKLYSDGSQMQDNVTVFRRSDVNFRIVRETVSVDFGRLILPLTIQTDQDRVIPRYALPTMTKACFEMAIYSRNEETLYRFETEEDLFTFQRSLTGYEVSHDQSNIRCEFSRDCKIDCTGRIQLWQDPIDLPNLSDPSESGSPPRSCPSSNSISDFRSRQSSIAASLVPSTFHFVDDGLEAGTIKLPAMMIYTSILDRRDRSRFAMIFFELEKSIKIAPDRCNCSKSYKTCPYVCLERPHEKKIPIHVSMSELDPLGDPDPKSFDLLPFRRPRHPTFEKLSTKETSYVLLKFKSLAAKDKFHHELGLRFQVRDKQLRDQEDTIRRLARRESKPTRNINQQLLAPLVQRSASYLQDDLPPMIEKFEIDTDIEKQWVHEFELKGIPSETRAVTGTSASRVSVSSPRVSSAGVGNTREISNLMRGMKAAFEPQNGLIGSNTVNRQAQSIDGAANRSEARLDPKAKGGGGWFGRQKHK